MIRRLAVLFGIALAALLALLVVIAAIVFLGANTGPGRRALAWLLPRVTGGEIHASGISGSFPSHLRARRLTVSDHAGVWLKTEDLRLDWRPAALFSGKIIVDRLAVQKALLVRLPEAETSKKASSKKQARPRPLIVHELTVAELTVGPKLAPSTPSFSLEGSLRRTPGEEAVSLAASAADGGHYTIEAKQANGTIALDVNASEPAKGPLAALAKLPDLGPVRIDATATGPESALGVRLHADAGPLVLNGTGSLDLTHETADLSLAAHAPRMQPRPDLGWQSLALDATVKGPLRHPNVSGRFTANGVAAAGGKLRALEANVQGSNGKLHLTARLSGIELPGSDPTLLAGAPLVLEARADLRAAKLPVTFTLRHPLISAEGSLDLGKPRAAIATITLPEIAPFAKIARIPLAGRASLEVNAKEQAGSLALNATGDLDLADRTSAAARLLGAKTKLKVVAKVQGHAIQLAEFSLHGANASMSAHGELSKQQSALSFAARLGDPARFDPRVAGNLRASGDFRGNTKDFSLTASLDGTLGVRKEAPGAIHAELTASGPAKAPKGEAAVHWTLGGAPLDLALAAQRTAAGTIALAVRQASWKSASATGEIDVGSAGGVPSGTGEIDFRIGTLADFSGLAGKPLTGSLEGSLTAPPGPERLVLRAEARGLGNGSASIGRADLTASLDEPRGARRLDALLALSGVDAGKVRDGRATITARGTAKALAFTLAATAPSLGNAKLASSGALDLTQKSARIASLSGSFHGTEARLLAPTEVTFSGGIALGQARIGIDGAELAIAGRITPGLALTATLRNVQPSLLARAAPKLPVAGELEANAQLSGTLAEPRGTVRINARDLRLTSPTMAGLPHGSLVLTANLANRAMHLEGDLSFGPGTKLTLSGSAPLTAQGGLDLKTTGRMDLAALNPVLGASGRRVTGRLTLAAAVRGSPGAPEVSGEARLSGGSVTDYETGLLLQDIAGEATIGNKTLRIVRLSAKAGSGRISAAGTIGIGAEIPVALRLTADDAELLQSDRLHATLDANLALEGSARRRLSLRGDVRIRRAEIQIPKKLPRSIPTLDVVRPGSAPPRRAAPATTRLVIALDVLVTAPRQVFVRGRGVDAEFGGRIRVTGTTAAPKFAGGLNLIRGDLSLAGQTLTFTKGTIGFNGGSVSDPTLDLEATTSTSTTTATLKVGGTARHPKITLTSTPELPQDQILAALLFGEASTKISPFQLAEIANALASLSGTGPSIGNPLGTIREGLGLDRLSVGSSANGSPTLQAGRYIAPGVYVGASQAASGGGAAANVEIDLNKHLKLKAQVGNRASGSAVGTAQDQSTSVGLSYQFEY